MITLQDLIFDYTARNVALGCVILGITCGVLGSFAVLRKQSLIGDALSHAALPGIVAAFLLAQAKAPIWLMLGAAIAAYVGMKAVTAIAESVGLSMDAALAIVLTTFFGFGVVLLSIANKSPLANQAGLDRFLFGQAASLVANQVYTMAAVGGAAVLTVALLYSRFKIVTFDPLFARSLGMPVGKLQSLLTMLLIASIVIGLNTVGVILMSAMIVAPAAAARQWTERLGKLIFLSALFGTVAGLFGAIVSLSAPRTPTGPVIVLALAVIVTISVLFAPARGIIWGKVRHAKVRRTAEAAL